MEEIEEVKGDIKDHETRIRNLEINESTIIANMQNLTESVNELVWWLKAIVLGTCSVGIGFIIWYIQK